MADKNQVVLIVDNEKPIQMMLKKVLEREGYGIVLASSGFEALNLYATQNIHAVLLDLGLPDMNGTDVLRQMKKKDSSIPIIMVTGNHDEQEAREAIECGALEYITKPIDLNYLKNILNLQSMG